MGQLKTKENEKDIYDFINNYTKDEKKKEDSLILAQMMEEITGSKGKMWGESIIGFGNYHYKSERSIQEGDWFLLGFSPRKAAISLYVFTGLEEHGYLLDNLGDFKKGKACIYIKSLSRIDIKVLKNLMKKTAEYLKIKYIV